MNDILMNRWIGQGAVYRRRRLGELGARLRFDQISGQLGLTDRHSLPLTPSPSHHRVGQVRVGLEHAWQCFAAHKQYVNQKRFRRTGLGT